MLDHNPGKKTVILKEFKRTRQDSQMLILEVIARQNDFKSYARE